MVPKVEGRVAGAATVDAVEVGGERVLPSGSRGTREVTERSVGARRKKDRAARKSVSFSKKRHGTHAGDESRDLRDNGVFEKDGREEGR